MIKCSKFIAKRDLLTFRTFNICILHFQTDRSENITLNIYTMQDYVRQSLVQNETQKFHIKKASFKTISYQQTVKLDNPV